MLINTYSVRTTKQNPKTRLVNSRFMVTTAIPRLIVFQNYLMGKFNYSELFSGEFSNTSEPQEISEIFWSVFYFIFCLFFVLRLIQQRFLPAFPFRFANATKDNTIYLSTVYSQVFWCHFEYLHSIAVDIWNVCFHFKRKCLSSIQVTMNYAIISRNASLFISIT